MLPAVRRLVARFMALAALLCACGGSDRPAGSIEGESLPAAWVEGRQARQDAAGRRLAAASSGASQRRILFGDLHVHTTYSIDAFLFSLPFLAGEGAHPPADACDFARYCAQLDFFSLNDHAEGLTPEHWQETKQSLRECNARAGDPSDPDLVGFVGWEWTQVGETPEDHWGHKNVMFPGLQEEELPLRPIDSTPDSGDMSLFAGLDLVRTLRFFDPLGWGEYADFAWLVQRLAERPLCPKGVDTRQLPPDCRENAPTPRHLFEKLEQWGLDVLVIPHGTTWGFYTPPGTSFDKALDPRQHDPQRQRLIEIFSGHGNSEEYRPWRAADRGAAGEASCPAPRPDFLPCCWRAGEIIRERCGDAPRAVCEERVEEAQRLVLEAGAHFPLVIPDASAEDWLDCDQCRDCFKPSLGFRPGESVQYAMALSRFDDGDAAASGDPQRFRYGFIASSDNHTARPGTGYKQYDRRRMTEATGLRSGFYDRLAQWLRTRSREDASRASRPSPELRGFLASDAERVASYLYPGGLVAVHADDRSREAIWAALGRREVYGTSGPRILLWFDLLNGPDGRQAMGSGAVLGEPPRFEVRAAGAFVQQPGCPEVSRSGLAPARLERLCRGECYHPGDERHPIDAIEIVRIRPQVRPDEPVEGLIEDPWRRFECAPDPTGCTVRFEDPEFPGSRRDVLYYARAIQAPTPAVNGANLRARRDASGAVVETQPCYGSYRTSFDDDCLAPVSERAWSSPIFVDQAPPASGEGA
jgi:hypothetical protein